MASALFKQLKLSTARVTMQRTQSSGFPAPHKDWQMLSETWFDFHCCCAEPGIGLSVPHASLPTQDIPWFHGLNNYEHWTRQQGSRIKRLLLLYRELDTKDGFVCNKYWRSSGRAFLEGLWGHLSHFTHSPALCWVPHCKSRNASCILPSDS